MGQAFSKRVVPLLDRLRARQEKALLDDALQEIERRKAEVVAARTAVSSKTTSKKGGSTPTSNHINPDVAKTVYIDPNARLGGFQRGQQYQVLSEDDLSKQISSGEIGQEEEMPADLIKFLNDAGPATKVENIEFSNDISKRKSVETVESSSSNAITAAKKARAPRVERLMTQSETDTDSSTDASQPTKESNKREDDEEYGRLTDDEINQILFETHGLPNNKESARSNKSEVLSPSTAIQNALRHVGIPIIVRDKSVLDNEQDPNVTKYQAGWFHEIDDLIYIGPQVYPPTHLFEEDQAQFTSYKDLHVAPTDDGKGRLATTKSYNQTEGKPVEGAEVSHILTTHSPHGIITQR